MAAAAASRLCGERAGPTWGVGREARSAPSPFAPAASGPAREWAGPRARRGGGGGGCGRGAEPGDCVCKSERSSWVWRGGGGRVHRRAAFPSPLPPGFLSLPAVRTGDPGRRRRGALSRSRHLLALPAHAPGGGRWLVLPSAAPAPAAGPASARPSPVLPPGRRVWAPREARAVGLAAWPETRVLGGGIEFEHGVLKSLKHTYAPFPTWTPPRDHGPRLRPAFGDGVRRGCLTGAGGFLRVKDRVPAPAPSTTPGL